MLLIVIILHEILVSVIHSSLLFAMRAIRYAGNPGRAMTICRVSPQCHYALIEISAQSTDRQREGEMTMASRVKHAHTPFNGFDLFVLLGAMINLIVAGCLVGYWLLTT